MFVREEINTTDILSGVTENIRASLKSHLLDPKPKYVLGVSQALGPLPDIAGRGGTLRHWTFWCLQAPSTLQSWGGGGYSLALKLYSRFRLVGGMVFFSRPSVVEAMSDVIPNSTFEMHVCV
ncbi:hypothetical protein TNCV_2466891 [Trichonephila clavipes]|nr:hypothetical protein TNCV_2466891 [Trichonephila clavipes]